MGVHCSNIFTFLCLEVSIIKYLKPKQIIGVEGHFEELISHPDRGLSHIELEHVVDKIITSE